MADMPIWAQRLAERVALNESDLDNDVLPTIVWRRRKREFDSSGHYDVMHGRIVISAGRDKRAHRLVLMHELTHWLAQHEYVGPVRVVWHGQAFWDMCYVLSRRYGVTRRLFRQRYYDHKRAMAASERRLTRADMRR